MSVFDVIADNLAQVGIGVVLFTLSYLANVSLGVWQSVKIDGYEFDKKLLLNSVVKFVVLIIGIAFLTIVVSAVPAYASSVGVSIEPEALKAIDTLVIMGGFLSATYRYTKDALNKLNRMLKG